MSSISRLQEVNQLAQAKIKDKTASEAIIELINTLPEEVYQNSLPCLTALFAKHYRPAARTAKDTFGLVARFCSKGDIREYFNFVYSTGSELVGTDGNALIVCKCQPDEWPAGYYDPKTRVFTAGPEEYRYPNYKVYIVNNDRLSPIDKDIIDTRSDGNDKRPTIVHKVGKGYYCAEYLDLIPDTASDWFQEPEAKFQFLFAKSPDGVMTIVIAPWRVDSRK